jgi:hypothetical protein
VLLARSCSPVVSPQICAHRCFPNRRWRRTSGSRARPCHQPSSVECDRHSTRARHLTQPPKSGSTGKLL